MFIVILIVLVILAIWYYSQPIEAPPADASVSKQLSASEVAAANLTAAEAPKGVAGSGSVTASAGSAGSAASNIIPPVAVITPTTQADVAKTSSSSTTGAPVPNVSAPIVPAQSGVSAAMPVSGATAGQLSSMLPTYNFYPGMTFGGNDLANTGLTDNVPKLAAWCDANVTCKGFTTDAWMKSTITPQDKWYKWSDDPKKGLYVKK